MSIAGRPVTADDVQLLAQRDGPKGFVRLCAAVIGAALSEAGKPVTAELTERIHLPDGGVDARVSLPSSVPETRGLIGPGTSVFQFKTVEAGFQPRQSVLDSFLRKLRGALPAVNKELGRFPDRYVVVTNFDLDGRGRRRVENALRADAPGFQDRPIVIWGAAELAAFLTLRPHLRHAFLGEEELSTVDVALGELRRSQHDVPWPAELVNREKALERIRRFVTEGAHRVLHVHGPRLVGKTRTVAEALRPSSTEVIWARTPARVSDGLVRALDAEPRKVVLVIDGCDLGQEENLRTLLLGTGRLKTVTIGTSAHHAAGMENLPLEPLEFTAAHNLARAVAPDPDWTEMARSWLVSVSGGLPGILLHAQWVAGTDARESGLRGTAREKVEDLVWDRLTSGLTPEQQLYLQLFAVVSDLRIDDDPGNELAMVADAFDLDAPRAREIGEELLHHHLLLARGPNREVVPPVLAISAAAKLLRSRPDGFDKLLLRLPPTTLARFLGRVADLEQVTQMEDLVRDLLSAPGLLDGPQGLLNAGPNIVPYARRAPSLFLDKLGCLFERHGTQWIHEGPFESTRHRVLRELEGLALKAEHFERSAARLLDVAETEPRGSLIPFTDSFCRLFFHQHPEVEASLAVRASFLEGLVANRSARGRALLARACGTFAGSQVIPLHGAEGPDPPMASGLPRYWQEVFEYSRRILSVLHRLMDDADASVRVAAAEACLERFDDFVRLRAGQPAINAARDALQIVPVRERRERRMRLHESIDRAVEEIEDPKHQREPTDPYAPLVEPLRALRAELFSGSIGLALQRWAGSLPPAEELAELESDLAPEQLPRDAALHKIVREVAGNPEALDPDTLDWLFTLEAHHAWRFFQLVGREDNEKRWLQRFLERGDSPAAARNFAAYLAGRAEGGCVDRDQLLDELLNDRGLAERLALPCTLAFDPSPAGIERFRRLAHPDLVGPVTAASRLADSGWARALKDADVEQVLTALGDQDGNVGTSVVRFLARRIWKGEGLPGFLEPGAWTALERAVPEIQDPDTYRWETLASRLGAQDSPRLLQLMRRVLRMEGADGIFRSMRKDGPLWRQLHGQARADYFALLVEALADDSPASVWIQFHAKEVIDPDADAGTLLEVARRGPQHAEAVAEMLDATKNGFWRICGGLLSASEHAPDDRLEKRLFAAVGSTGIVRIGPDGLAPLWEQRLQQARELLSHPSPRVRRWAADVADWLTKQARKEREGGSWLWDHPFSHEEIRQMVERKGSPERSWALKRLLQRAPSREALDYLTRDDIEEGLDLLPEDDPARRKWETYLRRAVDVP
jgi:hypothetical protein